MSRLPAAYLPSARDDIDGAYLHYEQQRVGLGDRFAEAVRDQVATIQGNLLLYGVVYKDVRAAAIHRFPYVVFYPAEANRVLVIAVQHGSRDWSSWQSRS